MNKLSFKIRESIENNAHEVRIFIDDEDFLGEDFLGIDPPWFFRKKDFCKNGELMVGMCTCGVEGCGDYFVDVTVNEETICWKYNTKYRTGLCFIFDKVDYISTIKNTGNDHSWENIQRKVERLVTEVLINKAVNGHPFDWASARIKENTITLCCKHNKNSGQIFYELDWDGVTDNNMVQYAERFLKEHP